MYINPLRENMIAYTRIPNVQVQLTLERAIGLERPI